MPHAQDQRKPRPALLSLVALALLGASAGWVAYRPPATPPAATLDDLKFLAGAWQADRDGELVEEHWTEPAGDAIMGMFRWVGRDGKTRLMEILSIRADAGGPTLRLRHFDGALTPWLSEAAGIPALPLTEHDASRAVFTNTAADGLKAVQYAVRSDELHITVMFHDAARKPLQFRLKRRGL